MKANFYRIVIGASLFVLVNGCAVEKTSTTAIARKPQPVIVAKSNGRIIEKVHRLVELYAEGAGQEQIAAASLVRIGDDAKRELIAMLKARPTEAGAIAEILQLYFPSSETARLI